MMRPLNIRGFIGILSVFTLTVLAVSACSSPPAQGISQRADALRERLRGGGNQTSDISQQSTVSTQRAALPTALSCPGAELRDGTQTDRVYGEGRDGDPEAVLYQGSINRVARECIAGSDGSVAIRFGITGRVILGPLGLPGPQTVNIRAVLFNEDTGAVWSELFPVTVNLGPRGTESFTLVQQTPATFIAPGESTKYRVIIGFDSQQ